MFLKEVTKSVFFKDQKYNKISSKVKYRYNLKYVFFYVNIC